MTADPGTDHQSELVSVRVVGLQRRSPTANFSLSLATVRDRRGVPSLLGGNRLKTTPNLSGVEKVSLSGDGGLLVLALADFLLVNLDHVDAGVLDLLHHAAGHRIEIVIE